MDARIQKLAKNLINYSCEVKAGDKVLIHYIGASTTELSRALIKETYAAGAAEADGTDRRRSDEADGLLCRRQGQ